MSGEQNLKNSKNLKNRAMDGITWKLLEKIGMQAVQFVIQIVLARLLLPEDYGVIGLLTIFITTSDVFVQQGLTTALIQKKKVDSIDLSSVFYANIFVSIILYALLYLSAPLIANFYKENILIVLTRVLSLNIIIGAFSAIHFVILSRNLDFKKSFFSNMANIVTQGVFGIILALNGYGLWSLVISKLAGSFIGSLVLWFYVKWKPSKEFSLVRLKEMFSYSSKILGTNLLNTIFNNIHSLIIGHYYSSDELGYYQRGQQIPQTIMTAIDGSLSEVIYPTLSMLQDDIFKLKNTIKRTIKISMYITLPLLVGLYIVAKPLTIILLTDKWLSSVPFMQLTCLICMFWPLSSRMHAINAIGKSDITLRLSVVTKIITLLLILLCAKSGIYAIMLATLIASIITMFILSYYSKKYINYGLMEMCKDILPSIILSLVMGFFVILIGTFIEDALLRLLTQIISGIIIYISGSNISKNESFYDIIEVLKSTVHSKENS